MPFVAVTSGFAFLSSLFHLFVLIGYKTYIADLRKVSGARDDLRSVRMQRRPSAGAQQTSCAAHWPPR